MRCDQLFVIHASQFEVTTACLSIKREPDFLLSLHFSSLQLFEESGFLIYYYFSLD